LTVSQTLTSSDNITWTLGNLSGLTGTQGSYTLTLSASGIADSATNTLASGASTTWTVDTTSPTVTINQASTQADPVTNAANINFTAVFNEPVTGFNSSGVSFSGAGATTATVTEIAPMDGTTYNVQISGMNANGIITASINAGAAQDVAGNLSQASTSTDNQVTYHQDSSTIFVVNSLANTDDGFCSPLGTGPGNHDCTLREAINAANADFGAETITFDPAVFTAPGPYTITLSGALGALPDITDDVTITGPAAVSLTISGNNTGRVFTINSGKTVSISNLTITGGQANFGGGIYNLGNLTISNSTFTGNKAVGGSGKGGAIDSEGGTLYIVNTTISGNSAETDGGGLLSGGTSSATLTNVTLTNNRSDADNNATGDGGGIGQVSSNAITLRNRCVGLQRRPDKDALAPAR
ncbi:MAG: hypothetical protein DMF68_16515, partial [Acidobacteria bacterium]